MKTYYITKGPVRGQCGHKHHSLISAFRCQAKDSRACKRSGGYSDRSLVIVENGIIRAIECSDISASDARAMGYSI
jgi:hypothetical protein